MNTQTETDPTITVDYWRWSAVKGLPREPGVKIGRGRHFMWIPMNEVMPTATALLDWIQLNRDTINQSSNQENS